MAAPARGLSPSDLGQIRDTLASGRKPRVVFTETAGQVAGTLGQVVELADPAASDEWIVVRFGRDELPFSPTDLAIPGRGTPRKATKPESKPEPKPAPPLRLVEPPHPERPEAKGPERAEAKGPESRRETRAAKAVRPEPTPAPPEPAAVPAPRKPTKPKPPASLTVTLSYTEREWMVAATMGSKTLAKPYVIRPTDALRMVALLDVPGVHDAVESIIAAERVEAEGRAQRLRSELADIEARLAELTQRAP